MITNYIKTAWRNLWRNKVFTLINILGLAFGLASILSLALLVNQYFSRDEFHERKDRMYYLKTTTPDGNSHQQTTFPLLDEIAATCPEVEAASHWQIGYNPWLSFGEYEVQENTVYVDPDFLQLFSFKLAEGEPTTAMHESQSLVISKRVKTQLFGDKPALGEMVIVSDSIPRTVTGVLDIPATSSLAADVFLPVQFLRDHVDGFEEMANWYNVFAPGYLVLRDGADPERLNQKIAGIVQHHYAPQINNNVVNVVPFTQLKTEVGDTVRKVIIGAVAAAVFILLIIVVNLINLNMAILFRRTKDVAVRRIVGSSKWNSLVQFGIENGLVMILSLILGLIIFRLVLLRLLNDVIGGSLGQVDLQPGYAVAILVAAVALAAVFLAAIIPSLRLNSLRLTEAVKGKVSNKMGKSGIRNTFITTQFVLGITFLCMAFILNKQIRHMKSTPLGFNAEDVVVGTLDLAFEQPEQADSRFDVMLQSLKANPYVKAISTSQEIPTAYWGNGNGFADVEGGTERYIQYLQADAGFAETFQIPIVAGRNFDDRLKATEDDKILINETAATAFGWTDPIGKKLRQNGSDQVVTVIGVMKDFHYGSLAHAIGPLIHFYGGEAGLASNSYLSIRIDPQRKTQIMAELTDAFKQIPSKKTFAYQVMDERVANQYALLDGILVVTNYVALLILLIACMGLLGLSTIFAQQRVKEIGIRKVLGASVSGIVRLLSTDFIKLVVMAVVIASPIAWWAMNKWLEDFAYRIDIQWWMFAVAGSAAVVIALLTVSWQAIRAAVANPVESLRDE
ncbi:MAG TPA: ABC transporter permease [Parapedobacter sp.]|uniref:ABC transporter permease n=1 Tax=Parapedobacter sp. TaxID=1958893 RepID=UPI002C2A4BC3|nr:ABC transporter permease [Parapedobacter sp.]HWK58850.1 ABC transporter permease [Parapedobacter sp.]